MTFSNWVRQAHRWLAILFTLTVIANFAVRAFGEPRAWITYSPLPPLFLMLLSGLYMFFLPYARRARSAEA
jgi:L-asparagine transporter-like permease